MMDHENVRRRLFEARSEVWAIVYAYEPPIAPRSLWYDRWRYDVINDYVEAVSYIGAEPMIIDVDSFIASQRLRSGELSLVVNLNSGATPISNLGLIPSLAAWHKVACFPSSADVLLSGERKDICKRFFSAWFRTPRDFAAGTSELGDARWIRKPRTMGNSQGIARIEPELAALDAQTHDFIIEEFIEGYDVTIPVIFDVIANDYVTCPPIVYLPDDPDPRHWFLSYAEKMDRKKSIERRIGALSEATASALRQASRHFRFDSIARYDFRWRPKADAGETIELDDLWFLEINCLPTLRTDVNFLKSIKAHMVAQPDCLIEQVSTARTADISALAYLLAQFRMRQATTR